MFSVEGSQSREHTTDKGVKINHKRALLCPVSETELWGELQNTDLVPSVRDWREETLGMKISTIQTKQTRKNSVTQKPQITWSTWKGNSWSNHCKCATQHHKSAQTLNINKRSVAGKLHRLLQRKVKLSLFLIFVLHLSSIRTLWCSLVVTNCTQSWNRDWCLT